MCIRFKVTGQPVTQGSVTAMLPPGAKFPIVRHVDNDNLRAWREAISISAKTAFEFDKHNINPYPVAVRFVFDFVRPPSHYRQGKNSHLLTKDAPPIPHWDLDKLVRAACDALTGVCWVDDKQVCDIVSAKRYGPQAGLSAEIQHIFPVDRTC